MDTLDLHPLTQTLVIEINSRNSAYFERGTVSYEASADQNPRLSPEKRARSMLFG